MGVRDGVATLLKRLEDAYGVAEPPAQRDCLETLVACVLSQHTSDTNSHRAYINLLQRFPTWEDVLHSPVEALEDAIRPAGLAPTRARTLQRILTTIRDREGVLSLERLRSLPAEKARAYLLSLPGVGPKTAAIVLCFAMGRPVLPVDTHVHRVAMRLGLIGGTTSLEKAHDALGTQVPDELAYRFHKALVRHGKLTCRARRPLCTRCALRDICPSAT